MSIGFIFLAFLLLNVRIRRSIGREGMEIRMCVNQLKDDSLNLLSSLNGNGRKIVELAYKSPGVYNFSSS